MAFSVKNAIFLNLYILSPHAVKDTLEFCYTVWALMVLTEG